MNIIAEYKIQKIFQQNWEPFCASSATFPVQEMATHAIMNCKTGNLGVSVSQYQDCGHIVIHNNSCRNRNCPNCQAVQKEIWVDQRREEVIDSPYFHFPTS